MMNDNVQSARNANARLPVRRQLRWNLIAYSVLLAIIPILVLGLVVVNVIRERTIADNTKQLENIATLRQDQITSWLSSADLLLHSIWTNASAETLIRSILVSNADASDSVAQLDAYLKDQADTKTDQVYPFKEFFLFNTDGLIVSSSDISNEGKTVVRQPYFMKSLEAEYIQFPYYDVASGELVMYVMQPIVNTVGQTIGVIAGRLDLVVLENIMTQRQTLGESGETYLISSENNFFLTASRFLAGAATSRAYRSEGIDRALAGESGSGVYGDYRNPPVPVVGVYRWMPELGAAFLTEIDEAEALQVFNQISGLIAMVSVVAAAIAAIIAYYYASRFSKPVIELTQVAARVAQGDLSQRAPLTAQNEIGILAQTFNSMSDQLNELVGSLEARVQARTADLSKTVEVGRLANSINEEDVLLPRLVEYIRSNFNLYYTQIYLLDEAQRYAVLRAGTGDVGQQLLARKHRLDVAQTSLVARAVQSGLPVVVSDTQNDATHKPNVLLPDTRSEVAIPLKVGNTILGVLDMQANQPNTFNNENAAVFEAMGGEIASAIRSAQAFDEAQAAAVRAEALNERLTSETWQSYLGNLGEGVRLGYEYDLEVPRPLSAQFDEVQDGSDENKRVHPITVRGATIGTIVVKNDEGDEIREDAQALIQDTANLMSAALERFRALDELNQSQEEVSRRASQLETVALVSAASASILDLDLLLQSVSELTKDNFSLYHAHFYLLDDRQENLVLAAGSGEAGQIMRTNHHSIPLSRPDSLVATAARGRSAQISNDVTQAPNFLPNPLLPETRSEMALPLIVGDLIIGVMDVQSDVVGRFNEDDVRVMTTLADQIAVAVKNARAFEEQLKTAERLREVDRLKSQFLANMSHELRTPLNSIIGYAEVLLDGIDGELNDEAQQDVEAIHNGGKHLLTIINDILDLAKIEAGQMMMDRREINPIVVVEDVMNTCDILARNKGLSLQVETIGEIPTVKGDGVRLKQVVLNLVNNAIKFTEQGMVTVELERYEHNQLAIRIKDSGMGMTPEEMSGLFQQFHQVDGSPTRRAGGTGLGLVISRHLVHMHGGEIYVESEKDVGTTFWFTLPVYTHASQTMKVVQA